MSYWSPIESRDTSLASHTCHTRNATLWGNRGKLGQPSTSVPETAKIVELISNSGEIDCAVAFWGRGATDLFPSTREKSIRIICDLMSGACNPAVIRDLMKLGAEIKKAEGMHAKIYWTQTGAIFGSANASTNGLGEEDVETSNQAEAAVYTDEPEVLREAAAWFNEQWKNGVLLDEPLLRQAE
jgi:hypothetical protein